ncbi:outer membrane beta-barrel protein [Flavobacterium psychrotrophum]|uniref:outer membrane beta-barrel protein n=1 Tax=Flavobacterium psychrotrophum TaxID=2294119 RepID=UPI000E315144|nr:outer membrane beta-barrel protein [Flavobacterium psychrotrophum]
MENKKDIGQAVRSKLDGLQSQPAPAVWESIRTDLDSRKQPRHFPLWLSVVTVVGVLAVFITLGYVFGLIPYPDNPLNVREQNVENTNAGNDKNDESVNTSIVHLGDDKSQETGNSASENENGGTNNTENETNGIINPDETTARKQKSINSANKRNDSSALAGKDAIGTNKDDTTGEINTAGSGKTLKENKSGKKVNNALAKAGRNDSSRTRNDNNIQGVSKQKHSKRNSKSSTNHQQSVAGSYIKKNVSTASESNASADAINKNVSKQASTTEISTNNEELTIVKENATATTSSEKTEPAVIDSLAIAKVNDSLKKTDKNLTDEKKNDNNTNDGYKQFYAYAYAAPTAFRYPSGKSLLDPKLNGNKTSSKVTFNYGAFLGYKVSDRFEIRAGIAITRTEQETSGVASDTTGSIIPPYTGIEYDNGVSNETLATRFDAQPFTITQKTQFTEIPVEVAYRLTGEQWGIKVIAGLSIIHISKNELMAHDNLNGVFLGSLKNTSATSFSAGLGAGLYYKLSPSLQINAEPFVKYYVNTFTAAKPISFSLRIGIQYNFNLPKKKK